ncbi:MAG: LytTR family DNA-binding domain-containing protein [Bacteroidota bacterium]
MKINCIIVEDEPLALERIKTYVLKLDFLNLLQTFDSGMDALFFLQSNTIDLIFLDINIGDISGIQLLESAKIKSEVIIITAYDDYALKGFELNVTDYLMKPYSFERFIEAVAKAKKNLTRDEPALDREFVFVKTAYQLEKLMLHDILYIEGMRDYRKIHTGTKKIMTLQTFATFEKEIPPAIICRVHKSYMVAIAKIDAVERAGIKIQDTIIPVSETYKKKFLQIIQPRTK